MNETSEKVIISTELATAHPDKWDEPLPINEPFLVEAEVEINEPYRELRVGVKNKTGDYVADVLIGYDPDGELRVLLTTDGDGNGDHQIAIFPMRELSKAIDARP